MASFFRKRIAQKVIPFLLRSHENKVENVTSVVSSLVIVSRLKGPQTQLVLSWKRLQNSNLSLNNEISPSKLVTLLRNQGLPTAEGFIDIELDESFNPALIFTVDKHVFSKIVLMDIGINSENLAKSSCLFEDIEPKNVLVTCMSPSVGEVFHMTHFRSAIHCKFIANVNKFVGHNVLQVNYVDDYGLEAAILLAGHKLLGSEDDLLKNPSYLSQIRKAASSQYKDDIFFQEEADTILDKMNKGDRETILNWNYLRNIWLKHHKAVYNRLGIHHDDIHFNSSCKQDIMNMTQQLLDSQFISFDQKGQVKISECETNKESSCSKNEKFEPILHLLSKYTCAAIHNKEKHNFDSMFYIVPAAQSNIFESVLLLLNKMGYKWSREIKYIKLKDIKYFGQSRQKRFEDILDKTKLNILNKLHNDLQLEINKSLEEMAEILSISSLYINAMKHRRNIDYEFMWDDIMSFGKDSAASFQFCYAGLKGLQEDSEYKFKIDNDTSPLLEPSALNLIKHLSRFDEIVYKSHAQLEPCILVQYLSSLWYFIDTATNVLRLDIKMDKLRVIKARLLLLSATMKVLRTGLELLGLTPLESKYTKENSVENEI